jgi:hypothetical protein
MITQSMCRVCAPLIENVQEAVAAAATATTTTTGGGICAKNPTAAASSSDIAIISLEPTSLLEVADTFVTVAEACGVKERGVKLHTEFVRNLQLLQLTVTQHHDNNKKPRPRLLLLEWLDPPFDGGHWVPEMISYAGCDSAAATPPPSSSSSDGATTQESQAIKYNSHKSKQLAWEAIYELDPDCVLIACCGFETHRNVLDAKRLQGRLSQLRAFREHRIYACNGNMYTARPGPSLLSGCAIMARVAYDTNDNDNDELIQKLEALPFTPPNNGDHAAWEKVVFDDTTGVNDSANAKLASSSNGAGIPDMEDLVTENDRPDFYTAHKQACEEEKLFYDDPETGFKVFTELAHKKRGKCCGSGTYLPYTCIHSLL